MKFMDNELKVNKDIFSLQKTGNINLLSPQSNTDTDHSISPAIQNIAASQHNPQDDMQCQKLSSPDMSQANFINSMQNYYPPQAAQIDYQSINGKMGMMSLTGSELQVQSNMSKASELSNEI